MSTIFALLMVLTTLLLPFLDKMISYLYPNSSLSKAEDDYQEILNDGDCSKIPFTD